MIPTKIIISLSFAFAACRIIPTNVLIAVSGGAIGLGMSCVGAGSVVREGAPALRLVRLKMFPQTFAAIFHHRNLIDIKPGDKVQMNVRGVSRKGLKR